MTAKLWCGSQPAIHPLIPQITFIQKIYSVMYWAMLLKTHCSSPWSGVCFKYRKAFEKCFPARTIEGFSYFNILAFEWNSWHVNILGEHDLCYSSWVFALGMLSSYKRSPVSGAASAFAVWVWGDRDEAFPTLLWAHLFDVLHHLCSQFLISADIR